ncbi:MAG: hypothetical protein PHW03_09755 [Eubacteriales bacterium]|nr:hypothetical protein [Eubacteriales bacterium]
MHKLINSKKFHHMQATLETVVFDDGTLVLRLVSYESVICDIDMLTGTIFIYPRHQYSSTTIRQLTRFLNEYMPLAYGRWSIGLIRYLQEKSDSDGYATLYKYGIFFREHVLGSTRRW